MVRSIGAMVAIAMLSIAAAPQAASLQVDVDEDGRPDRFELQVDPPRKMFWVTVTMGNGLRLVPLSGAIDPGRAQLSLTMRDHRGLGDIRCAEWRPATSGNGVGCGVPVTSHSQPDRLVVVDTGVAKYLLIYGRQLEWGGRKPSAEVPVYFRVMPAIEGAPQPLP